MFTIPILVLFLFPDVFQKINSSMVNGQEQSKVIRKPSTEDENTFPKDWNITFNLFQQKDPNKQIILNFTANDTEIKNSGIDPKLRTKFIIHGWTSGFYKQDLFKRHWMKDMKDYILEQNDYNVICVDWSKPANGNTYLKVMLRVKTIGQMVAHFINRLINLTNIMSNDIHCIGHSLGAHVCGFVGMTMASNRLGQITGLDPAGPGFRNREFKNDSRPLNSSDANLVIIIHTSAGLETAAGFNPGGFIGISYSLGHYDFRVNGGNAQPMCKQTEVITESLWNALELNWSNALSKLDYAFFCPHETGYKYPIAKPENDCQFIAYKCKDTDTFYDGQCAVEGMPLELNFHFYDKHNNKLNETNASNNLFIKLGDSYPYCLFHYQIVVEAEGNATGTTLTLSGQKQVDIKLKDWPKNTTYYYLYTDKEELGTVSEATYSESNGVKIKAVYVNYMSHIDKSVRKKKSSLPKVIEKPPNHSSWFHWSDWFGRF